MKLLKQTFANCSDDSTVLFSESQIMVDLIKVYATGELTVVGFGGVDVPVDTCVSAYRDQLYSLIEKHNTKKIALDLTGLESVPRGLLGIILSLRDRVEHVEIHNVCDNVMDVLRIANLERLVCYPRNDRLASNFS